MVRPSYVLGGRAMEIVHDESGLEQFVLTAMEASRRESLSRAPTRRGADPDRPVPPRRHRGRRRRGRRRDRRRRGRRDGAHRGGRHPLGRLGLRLPPYSLAAEIVEAIETQARAAGPRAGRARPHERAVRRPDGRGIFILEVNPRASRTVPFVSKVTGVPLAKIAARIAVGRTLKEMGIREVTPKHVAVKEAVFPFAKFAGVDTLLGPEMRSTGEVMGIDTSFRRPSARARSAPARGCRGAARPSSPCRTGQAERRGRRQGARRAGVRDPGDARHARFLSAQGIVVRAHQQGARGAPPLRRPPSSTAASSWSSTPPRAPRRSRTRSPSGAPRS